MYVYDFMLSNFREAIILHRVQDIRKYEERKVFKLIKVFLKKYPFFVL